MPITDTIDGSQDQDLPECEECSNGVICDVVKERVRVTERETEPSPWYNHGESGCLLLAQLK